MQYKGGGHIFECMMILKIGVKSYMSSDEKQHLFMDIKSHNHYLVLLSLTQATVST